MRRLPLRVRITAASAGSTTLILLMLSLFVYGRLQAELQRTTDIGLQARAAAIAAAIGQRGGGFTDRPDLRLGGLAQIITPGGQVIAWSGSPAVQVPARTLRGLHRPAFLPQAGPRGSESLRLYALPVNEGGRLVIIAGASTAATFRTLARLRLLLLVADPAALALACLATWFLTGAALRPVERMRREAAAISVADPARRLPVPSANDEVARLGRTLNSLLDRLQAALDRERRLLGDASHELRTPLGTLKAELDLALSRARTAQELEATLVSASEETNRLALLAQELLALATTREGGMPIQRVSTGLSDLVEAACARHRPVAERHGAWIECTAEDADVQVDPVRVSQALDNLLDNAIRHSGAGGPITARAVVRSDMAVLTIENAGPGFAAEILPRAFEPFVSSGGGAAAVDRAGLGLAIVRAVAESHEGTASAENVAGGARVTMTLSLSPAALRPARRLRAPQAAG